MTRDEVYNLWLSSTKRAQGKPWKARKDFTSFFDNDPKAGTACQRLVSFFGKFSHIDPKVFFAAPYKLYPDTDYYPIEYYASRKALKTYTTYAKQLRAMSFDDSYQLKRMQASFTFIARFCTTNNISPYDYAKIGTGPVPTFVKHIKTGKVTLAATLVFPQTIQQLFKLPVDIVQSMLDSVDVQQAVRQFNQSTKAKRFAQAAFDMLIQSTLIHK